MKPTYYLKKLKELSKRYARAQQIPLHKARDAVAEILGFSHWHDVTKAHRAGWTPTKEHVSAVETLLVEALPGDEAGGPRSGTFIGDSIFETDIQHGTIDGHEYTIATSMGDVHLHGTGWHLQVPEAPYEEPRLEIAKQIRHEAPVYEAAFQQEVLNIAIKRAQQVRAGIASDWPRRSTKPDKDGFVRHPIYGAVSDKWFCLHCEASITGEQIAESLWHCPRCDASPLDVFESPWWLGEQDAQPEPIADNEMQGRPELVVDVLDTRLKLELDAEKVTLLIRSALVEDALNVSERLGALFADIFVHDDNDVCITFDEDLWPEHKEPISALAVAGHLGINVDKAFCLRELPFAWPGLGGHTESTAEYTQTMLKAYANQRAD
ncbi:P-loop NTPase family protein [Jannaschia ovalis]|uniref:Uncharacterized protein n=1 Tax=Jannaschia ovalis TaxID=3038773 RepID=A0ABY8L861_9RHOB|nr:hypothetical protein [Jannaschia sp. GRR-S6-38]WGH77481.1 hypothetical protein P8627_10550 [Jannaschia sp. GRR-S6-38]